MLQQSGLRAVKTRQSVVRRRRLLSNNQSHAGAHSDSKWLKLAGNKFIQSDFTSFDTKVSANLHYFRFRSLPGLHIQICQIVVVAIMIRQFHEFFELSIWRVFDNWPNCVLPPSPAARSLPPPYMVGTCIAQ